MSEVLQVNDLVEEGRRAYERGDYLKAAQAYAAAANGFSAQGRLVEAAELRNNGCVAYLQAGDAHAALSLVEHSAQVFAAAGDVRRQSLALGNLGAALEANGRLEEAAQAYQQSADMLRETGDVQMRLHVLQSLSALQLRTGKQLQALATMQSGLNSAEKLSLEQRMLKKILAIPFKMLGR